MMSSFMEFNDETFANTYNGIKGKCKSGCKNFAILKVAFASEEIGVLYEAAIEKHNKNFINNVYCDSGFDLFVPDNAIFDKELEAKFIDMKLKAEMVYCDVSSNQICPAAYYLYPRSSLSKTPLIMGNHVGIIDAGYRGHLIGMFDLSAGNTEHITKFDKYLQICAPGLIPIFVELVGCKEDLGEQTERGEGGFGSTSTF